jgi:hypothetical protein
VLNFEHGENAARLVAGGQAELREDGCGSSIDRGASLCDPSYVADELLDAADAVLEKVTDSLRRVSEQLRQTDLDGRLPISPR